MNHSSSRRFILLVTAVVSVFALSGSQCARVSDRLTAPTSGGNNDAGTSGDVGGVAACVAACNEIARNERRAEQDLHKANIQACLELSGEAKSECLYEEGIRHETRMEEIAFDQQECKSPCHEQGSGSGGQ